MPLITTVLCERPVGWQYGVTLFFNAMRPGLWAKHDQHYGTDFGVGIGTPVRASADGIVNLYHDEFGFGHNIVLTPDEDKRGWHIFGHLSRFAVQDGQRVKAGDVIGYSGNTGNCAGLLDRLKDGSIVERLIDGAWRKVDAKSGALIDAGAHLHFEVRLGGTTPDKVVAVMFRRPVNERGQQDGYEYA